MAQLFPAYADHLARALIGAAVLAVASLFMIGGAITRSPYVTLQDVPLNQPVQFSHEHHVAGLGIDCRYCHTSVADSRSAGMPSTRTCMTCHSQIWTGAELLEPVRESWRTGVPIAWQRVNNIPDFSHFSHEIHVNTGVSCATCHGRVNEMPLMWKSVSLQMQWCLSCHWDPGPNLVPPEEVFNMDYRPSPEQAAAGRERAAALGIDPYQITRCSTCHY